LPYVFAYAPSGQKFLTNQQLRTQRLFFQPAWFEYYYKRYFFSQHGSNTITNAIFSVSMVRIVLQTSFFQPAWFGYYYSRHFYSQHGSDSITKAIF